MRIPTRRLGATFTGALVAMAFTVSCAESKPPIMPDVVGKSLDVASSDIERAGFKEDIEVLGGGTFGVIDESNWTVCVQEPAGGAAITAAPRLTVDRSCGGDDLGESEETEPPKEEEESTQPPPTSSVDTEPEPEPDPAPEPEPEPVLTVENSPELAALLRVPDTCDDSIAAFATQYQGRTITFDGSIGALNNHGDYETRFDILVGPGDDGQLVFGPAFQFRDVNIVYDLHLTGPNIPDTLQVGQNLRMTAEIVEFNDRNCLFFLKPVSTEVR